MRERLWKRSRKPKEGRKGVEAKPNRATQKQRDAIASSGLTPLDYLLGVMRDEKADDAARRDAAKAAAPYVHARLSSVDMNAQVAVSSHDELVSAYIPKRQDADIDRRD